MEDDRVETLPWCGRSGARCQTYCVSDGGQAAEGIQGVLASSLLKADGDGSPVPVEFRCYQLLVKRPDRWRVNVSVPSPPHRPPHEQYLPHGGLPRPVTPLNVCASWREPR